MQIVDFYFDFSSTNSYFAAFILPEMCARNDAIVNWIPLHLGALFRDTGFDVMAMTRRKARYLWRDHARQGQMAGLPFKRPSRFPIKTADALRGVLAAARLDNESRDSSLLIHATRAGAETNLVSRSVAAYSQAVMRAYWERDEDIADRGVLARVAASAGLDSAAFIREIESSEVRAELTAITARAAERGVFGAPTFFIGDDMFWGKDLIGFAERWMRRTA